MQPSELKKTRAALFISQNSMAEALNISTRQYCRYESGVTPIPGPVAILVAMARQEGAIKWKA